MKGLLTTCIIIFFSTNSLYAQNKTIKGRVIDEDLQTSSYVSILVDDTVKVGKTDLNGFFQIDVPISVKKILFADVGMDLASIELVDECNEVEVVMILRGTYDFINLRKAERLQLRRYRKLPELHIEAFKKGLFTTDIPCYKRNIISPFNKQR